ncbi:MAG: hypothetical protein ACOC8E_05400 [Planctomycetota bacterium]
MNLRATELVLAVVVLLSWPLAAGADLVDEFDTDPVAGGRAVVVGNDTSRDTAGNLTQPFVHAGAGALTHNLHTNWDYANYGFGPRGVGQGSRLAFDLGRVYTEADNFSFGAALEIKSSGFAATSNQMMAIAFGLTNSTTTGMDRSGAWTGDRDTFDSVEWNFFPNQSTDFGWPTLQQTVIGPQTGDVDSMFSNFAANFDQDDAVDGGCDTVLSQEMAAGSGHPLEGNPWGLPLDTPMEVVMGYDAATTSVSMLVRDANTGQVLVDRATTLPDLDFTSPIGGFGSASGFTVDTLAITNYQDGWAFGGPTLVAEVEYDRVWFAETAARPVSEPGTAIGSLAGLALLARNRKRRT